ALGPCEPREHAAVGAAGGQRVERLEGRGDLELLAGDLGALERARERAREDAIDRADEAADPARRGRRARGTLARQRARAIVGPARAIARAGRAVPEKDDAHDLFGASGGDTAVSAERARPAWNRGPRSTARPTLRSVAPRLGAPKPACGRSR